VSGKKMGCRVKKQARNRGPEVIRIIWIAIVPGEKFMEVMGMTRVIAFKGFSDELVAYGEVVAPLLVTNHKAAKDNAVVRLHGQPHVGRIVAIADCGYTGHILRSL
jgi:hypothetical protein